MGRTCCWVGTSAAGLLGLDVFNSFQTLTAFQYMALSHESKCLPLELLHTRYMEKYKANRPGCSCYSSPINSSINFPGTFLFPTPSITSRHWPSWCFSLILGVSLQLLLLLLCSLTQSCLLSVSQRFFTFCDHKESSYLFEHMSLSIYLFFFSDFYQSITNILYYINFRCTP